MDPYLSPAAAARELGVGRTTIWRWIKKGLIESRVVAGYVAIPRHAIASAPTPKNRGLRVAKRAKRSARSAR